MTLRPATDADGPALVELITAVYEEYGEVMHTAGADSDLLEIESRYAGKGGAFVVLDVGGAVAGAHATLPLDTEAGLITFRRLYLARSMRGKGLGRELMDWAVGWARDHGFKQIQFWSDTRFQPAHAFFARYGFTQTGAVRDMDDGALPYSEYEFTMRL